MDFTTISIAVFSFLAISAVAGTISDYKKRRRELDLLQAAVERGQPLDPALIEHLTVQKDPPEMHAGRKSRNLRLGGVITVASGIGIALLALFLIPVAPLALYPILGVGVVIVCVGAGLLVGARVIERHEISPTIRDIDA